MMVNIGRYLGPLVVQDTSLTNLRFVTSTIFDGPFGPHKNLMQYCFCKSTRRVILATNCFSFDEVNLLSGVLTNKFHLKCSVNNSKNGYVINISSKSLFDLQELLKPHMPRMMQFKIGL
jgi:hypothetical protein